MAAPPKTKGTECPSCGRPLPNGTPECPYCGESIPGVAPKGGALLVFPVLLALCGGLDLLLSRTAVIELLATLRRLLTDGAALPVLLFSLGLFPVLQPPLERAPGLPTRGVLPSVAAELPGRLLYLLVLVCASFFAVGDFDGGTLYRICGVLALLLGLFAAYRFRFGRIPLLAAPFILAAVWLA